MRKYYSSRIKSRKIDINQLYFKLQNLFLYFRGNDYFKDELALTYSSGNSTRANYKASSLLNFTIFPLEKWHESLILEENMFDALEFLYDHVSKPGELVEMLTENNFRYQDYEEYDKFEGKEEFCQAANLFLCDYRDGYELSSDGEILSLGDEELKEILSAEIISYNLENIDSKVKAAVHKWKNRHLDIEERRRAIQDLADVFKWLKKSGYLDNVLDKKDDSLLFQLANGFAIRHHNPDQKTNYDKIIWYSWMFHFYLATYHAVIRMIEKKRKKGI